MEQMRQMAGVGQDGGMGAGQTPPYGATPPEDPRKTIQGVKEPIVPQIENTAPQIKSMM